MINLDKFFSLLRELGIGYYPMDKTNLEKLYEVATLNLGVDASPTDEAPDEFGCAETVADLVEIVRPDIQWMNRLSTAAMGRDLRNGKSFVQVLTPEPGSLVISATQGENIGHVGIYLGNERIASNDSRSGTFEDNYSLDGWYRYFEKKKRLGMLFYNIR